MEAKELRIGNLVKYSLSNIHQEIKSIISVHGEYIVNFKNSEFSNTIDKIKPIPLTEEWLLKFGFGKMRNKFYKKHVTLTKSEGFYVAFVQDELKSVHQLQNLYFALTGAELTQVSEGKK